LGAYQLGVYQALHEAGIEPDWVIGTSIGAINGALIAGNPPEQRLDRLREFWHRMERNSYGFDAMPRAVANAVRWDRAYRLSLSRTWRRGGIPRRASVSSMRRFIRPRLCAAPAGPGRFRLPQREAHAHDGGRGERPQRCDALLRHAASRCAWSM
jgi:hypothetical protein